MLSFSNRRESEPSFIFHQYIINLNIFNFNSRNDASSDLPKSDNHHAIFAFILQVLVEFLGLKYQGKDEEPFETRPKIMSVAITSLLIYYVSYFIKQKIPSSDCSSPLYASVVDSTMAIFGPLSLASLSSLLLPDSMCPALCMLALLLTLSQLPNLQLRKFFYSVLEELLEKHRFQFHPHRPMDVAAAIRTRTQLFGLPPADGTQINVSIL